MDAIEKIIEAGRSRGLSQAEIEERLKLAQGRLSKLKGHVQTRARWAEMVALASEVGLSLDELAGLAEPAPALSEDERLILRVWRVSGLTADTLVGALLRLAADAPPAHSVGGSVVRLDSGGSALDADCSDKTRPASHRETETRKRW